MVNEVDMTIHPHAAPHALIGDLLQALAPIGECTVVSRAGAVSANLPGSFKVGHDGADPADPYAIRMSACSCHLHLDWSLIVSFDVGAENVGYGIEPRISLRDCEGNAILNFYYAPEQADALRNALQDFAHRQQQACSP